MGSILLMWTFGMQTTAMPLSLPLERTSVTSQSSADTSLGEAGKLLVSLPGVSQVSRLQSEHFKEKYVFFLRQQLDAKNPSAGQFNQRVILCHRGFDRPTVIVTEGYQANYALREGYIEELSKLFDTNIITVEYRYFDQSMPSPCNWDYLTVENSLYDLHNVNQTLRLLYHGKWIATGISKGGQTTMFYRTYFPDDVDISVPYVAPLNRSVEDGRHERFLQYQVSTAINRQKVLDFQLELFKRKSRLLPLFEEHCRQRHYTFKVPVPEIFDYAVFEYAFAFWQWGEDVNAIPSAEASDKDLFNYWIALCEPDYFSIQNPYLSFDVQAARELGYYGYYTKPFKKYLSIKTAKGYLARLMLPDSLENIKFSPALYKHTVKFFKKNDPKMVYIYGDIDPWGASGIYGLPWTKDKHNLHVYMCPGGSHKTRILSFPEKARQEIIDLIAGWLKE